MSKRSKSKPELVTGRVKKQRRVAKSKKIIYARKKVTLRRSKRRSKPSGNRYGYE